MHLSIAVEEPYFKTALAPFLSCPNVLRNAHESTDTLAQWGPVYLNKAIDRLQEYISGLTLNYTHVYAMQQLCAYETVALGYSKFCGLFTEEEWRGFEYLSGTTVIGIYDILSDRCFHRSDFLVSGWARGPYCDGTRCWLCARTHCSLNPNATDHFRYVGE